MLVSAAKLEVVFRKLKQIKEHMTKNCLAPDRAKFSIEDLQWCISDMYDLKIEKNEVAFDGEHLYGMVERYQGRARILLRKDQPEDSMRFVTTKELCQIAIDEKEDWSPIGTTTLDSLLYEAMLDNAAGDGNEVERKLAANVAQSERMAAIAAMELMYPFGYRASDLEQIKEGKTTMKAIALHFHVPEFVIGTSLHPSHIALSTRGWKMVE